MSPPATRLLIANISWTLVGNAVLALCQLGMIVVIARWGNATDVGHFALALAISSPITVLLSLKLRAVLATDARGEYRFSEYVAIRAATAAILPVLAAVIATIGGYTGSTRLLIVVMSAAKAVDSLGDIVQGFFQRHERMDLVARSLMLRGVGSLIGLSVGYVLTDSLVIAVSLMVISSVAVFTVYDVSKHKQLTRSLQVPPRDHHDSRTPSAVRSDQALRLFRVALPLGVTVFLGSLWATIPRYFIEIHRGADDLGAFAVVSTFLAVGTIIINAVGQSASPRLANLYATRQLHDFDSLLIRLCGLGTALGIAGILVSVVAGKPLLGTVFGSEYSEHSRLLTALIGVMAIQYSFVFVGTAVNAMRLFSVQLPIHAASFSLVAILCLLLIPRYGLYGAAWAMAASNLLEAACYLALLLRHRRAATSSLGMEASG